MTAESINHHGESGNEPTDNTSPAKVAERYLNGIGEVYQQLGRCSCRGTDLYLSLPGERSRASVSYIDGAVIVVGDEVGDYDIFSMSDQGEVIHTNLDNPHLADRDTIDKLFDERLAGAQDFTESS